MYTFVITMLSSIDLLSKTATLHEILVLATTRKASKTISYLGTLGADTQT